MVLESKHVLRLTTMYFNDGVGKVRPFNKRSIECSERTQNSLIHQRHLLPDREIRQETFDNTKKNFLASSSAKAVLQWYATKAVRTTLYCAREAENGAKK